MTRTNQAWIRELKEGGALQETAIVDLREILLRASLFFFSRNLGDVSDLSRGEILQRAEDCAQDALIAVMDHLADFRGDSKFSTWAYKFAINFALMSARHERWKGISLDQIAEDSDNSLSEWLVRDDPGGVAIEQSAIRDELHGTIRNVIKGDLTEKQRQVLILIAFNEVPIDEVARHLNTNRNAVYKLLHDARQKLKSSLLARGFEMDKTKTIFESMG